MQVSQKVSRKMHESSKIRRSFARNLKLVVLGFVVLVLFIAPYLLLQSVTGGQVGVYVVALKNFIIASPSEIKNTDSKTNILILGKGGKGHEAPELTDTIILASISHTKNKIDLISLPRDIWVSDLSSKLNSVYSWGNQRSVQGGLSLAKSVVEEITGVPVHYGIVIDFSGLKGVVDSLGGINVNVRNSFIDERYPIAGKENDLCSGDPEFKCRYERVEFSRGMTKMDGELVLKFVRSRNSVGDEGTDFARSARQQLVIQAIMDRVLSTDIILSTKKMRILKDVSLDSIETDIQVSGAAILARRALDSRKNIKHLLLPENLLENPPKKPEYGGLYVFIPKKVDDDRSNERSWSEIQLWVKCVVESDNCS